MLKVTTIKCFNISLLLCLVSVVTAQQFDSNLKERFSKEQRSMIREKYKSFPDNTQLSISFIKEDKVSHIGILVKGDSLLFTDNKEYLFEIGSITKVFTSIILTNVVAEGLISLEDRIADMIKIESKNAKDISYLHLANHTSGLPRLPQNLNLLKANPFNPYVNYSEEDLVLAMSNKSLLNGKPGDKYDYSNFGAGLLGYLLTQIKKESYEALLKKYIFDPFFMQSSTSICPENSPRLVYGLDTNGDKVPNWDLNALKGAGGIYSSANDMSYFLSKCIHSDDPAIAATLAVTHKINDKRKMGLAWQIIEGKSNRIYWHNGGSGGYKSCLAFIPETQTAVLVLTNITAFHSKSNNVDDTCFLWLKMLNN